MLGSLNIQVNNKHFCIIAVNFFMSLFAVVYRTVVCFSAGLTVIDEEADEGLCSRLSF